MKETAPRPGCPLVDAVRTYPKSMLLVMGMRVAENACGYIFTVFVLILRHPGTGVAQQRRLRRGHDRRGGAILDHTDLRCDLRPHW